jgi:hypothetical protein
MSADYVKIRNHPAQGNTVAAESPVYQAMLVLLRELVQPVFTEQGLGQDVTIEVTLKITPTPRGGGGEKTR